MQQSLFGSEENILPYHGEAIFYPHFFSQAESDTMFHGLVTDIDWKQEPIKMFGKEVMQPRLTAWYGDAGKHYRYSGITMHPLAWTPILNLIRERIESVAKVHFTSALLNFYRDGRDSMGWHRDNEKELGPNPVIGSVSFGATRRFKFREYANKKTVRNIDLTHGSFLLMAGETQHYWEHQIPKISATIGSRINITLRVLV